MSYSCIILADSISPNDDRLVTMQVTFPRFILAEFNTHRMFSRNSASSRAIPVEKRIKAVREDPFIPGTIGKNKRGMQSEEELSTELQDECRKIFNDSLNSQIGFAEKLLKLGVHKQWANRLLELFSWHTVIVSATEWENFFALRNSSKAQPEMKIIASLMEETLASSVPTLIEQGCWHLPLIYPEDYKVYTTIFYNVSCSSILHQHLIKMSIARCARVSYLTHDGRKDPEADYALFDQLLRDKHLSPFEHVATPMEDDLYEYSSDCADNNPFCGNFRGWVQYRKLILGEDIARREV
jgi:hypothetical protein